MDDDLDSSGFELAMSYGMLRSMGATVRLNSCEDQGACFSINFPSNGNGKDTMTG
jgi:signal transduction histidine kinase